jgi:hypothetical protein
MAARRSGSRQLLLVLLAIAAFGRPRRAASFLPCRPSRRADIFPVWNCKLLNGIIDKAVERYEALDDNAKASIGEDLGLFGAGHSQAARDRSGVSGALSPETRWGARTISQFEKLLRLIDDVVARPEPAMAKPQYDKMDLMLA